MQGKKISVILFLSFLLTGAHIDFQQRAVKPAPPLPKGKNKIPTLVLKQTNGPTHPMFSQNQVLVKFKPSLSSFLLESTFAHYEVRPLRKFPHIGVFLVQIAPGSTVKEMLAVFNQNPDVEYAEPNYKTYSQVTPNDPLFQYQYALYNTGQSIGSVPGSPQGTSRADIKATEAWEETKGSQDVVVAVIDSGVDFDHPDLADKIVSGGRDFANDDFDARDDYYHGTFVSGLIAADTNNSEGMAGVAWNCKILPVKATGADGTGLYSWIIDGIMWAADQGVDIINMSIGGDEPSDALESALKYAYNKGVVLVAAAGNDAASIVYPAAYGDYVLAVAATDYNDTRVAWSAAGAEIDVAAPGERILSCVPVDYFGPGSLPYGFGSGTSASAPQVAGLAALIKSIKPWLSPKDIMNIIRYTADDTNKNESPGRDDFIGYGRINMEKALVPTKIK